jgi:DNA topoisomerase IB
MIDDVRADVGGAGDGTRVSEPFGHGVYHCDDVLLCRLQVLGSPKFRELGAAEDEKLANKNILQAVDAVAERLGNTRDIARSSYVSPRVIEHYLEGSVIACQAKQLEEVIVAEQGDLTEEEEALLELLHKKLRRELEQAA